MRENFGERSERMRGRLGSCHAERGYFSLAGLATTIVVFSVVTAATTTGSPIPSVRDAALIDRMEILVETARSEARSSGVPVYVSLDSGGLAACRSLPCPSAGAADPLLTVRGSPLVIPSHRPGYIEGGPTAARFLPGGGVEGWVAPRVGGLELDLYPETGLRRVASPESETGENSSPGTSNDPRSGYGQGETQ